MFCGFNGMQTDHNTTWFMDWTLFSFIGHCNLIHLRRKWIGLCPRNIAIYGFAVGYDLPQVVFTNVVFMIVIEFSWAQTIGILNFLYVEWLQHGDKETQ